MRLEVIVGIGPILLGLWCLMISLIHLLLLSRSQIPSRRASVLNYGWLALWFGLGIYVDGKLAELSSELFWDALPRPAYNWVWIGYFFTTTFFCFLFPPFLAWGILAMFYPKAVTDLHARWRRVRNKERYG
jgi:hypothetical protein